LITCLLIACILGSSRRVEKPLRTSAEENKRLYLQHFFGEDGREELNRKGILQFQNGKCFTIIS
jgi:hypothetical protein